MLVAGATGSTVAHIDKGRIGRDVRELSDSTGNAFGWALFRDSRQNQIKTFEYLWPHPGTSTPAPKVSFTSRIGGLVCGALATVYAVSNAALIFSGELAGAFLVGRQDHDGAAATLVQRCGTERREGSSGAINLCRAGR